MAAGLMPTEIWPILKLSLTRDEQRPKPLCFFWLPSGSHFFAFCSVFRLAGPYFFSMLKGCLPPAGAGAFAVNCERALIVQPAKKDGGFFYA